MEISAVLAYSLPVDSRWVYDESLGRLVCKQGNLDSQRIFFFLNARTVDAGWSVAVLVCMLPIRLRLRGNHVLWEITVAYPSGDFEGHAPPPPLEIYFIGSIL